MLLPEATSREASPSAPAGLEVSCRALEPYLAIAEEHGLDAERFAEGLDVDLDALTDPSASLSWRAFALLSARLERLVGGPEAMQAAGTRVMDAPMLRAFAKVVALFADVQRVYAASSSFSRSRLFRCIESTTRTVSKTELELVVTIPEPYEVSAPYFAFLAGVFEATPRVVGLPDAHVTYAVSGRVATYAVRHVPSATLWRRLRHVFRILFSARHTLAELEVQNQQLVAQLEEVAQARRLAEESSRLKSELLANVSHELRTPLNPVLDAAAGLAELDLEPEDRARLVALEAGGRRLVEVVEQLLDFSDLSAGALRIDAAPFDLYAMLERLREQTCARATDKPVEVRLVVDDRVPRHVIADERRLCRALLHLTDNAVKFSEAGEVLVRVTRKPDQDNRVRLAFEVLDDGPGIPPELQAALFGAFTQRDGSLTRQHGGLGLGLTIAQQLVRLMGGELELDSEEGRGSCFSFELSVRPGATRDRSPSTPARPIARPGERPAPGRAALGGATRAAARVLVVEDDNISQRLLVRMLKSFGCAVDVAGDGVQALEAVAEHTYDLVLMDCQMPNMDGLEATRRIRGIEPPVGRTPVVAVTAHAAAGHRDECIASGMDDYLTKPVDRKLVQQMLDRYAANDAEAGPAEAVEPR